MNENKPEKVSYIDYLYKAVMADTEALEDAKMTLSSIKKIDPDVYSEMIKDSISLIDYALSNPILSVIEKMIETKQEPVAWMKNDRGHIGFFDAPPNEYIPLYTAPQKREWADLTHEEIIDCMDTPTWLGTLLAIQSKIKEKNNG